MEKRRERRRVLPKETCSSVTYSSHIKENLSQLETRSFVVGFEVVTAVVMKSFFFWDIMRRSSVEVNLSFGGLVSIFRVEE
jgi:hypothetical protein